MRPSEDEWISKRDQIRTLYLDKDMPLKLVREQLAAQGFIATPRQYKTRLKTWKFNTKKIKTTAWQAMSTELQARKRAGMNTVFRVPIRGGGAIKVVTPQEVAKQSSRRSRRETSNKGRPGQPRLPITLDRASSRSILHEFEIQTCDGTTSCAATLPPLRNLRMTSGVLDAVSPCLEEGPELHSHSSTGIFSVTESSPVSTRIGSETSSSEISISLSILSSQMASAIIGSFTAHVMPLRYSKSPTSDSPFDSPGHGTGKSLSPMTFTDSVDRYDMAATLASFSLDSACSSVTRETFQRCMGDPAGLSDRPIPMDADRALAAQWVTPYLLESIEQRIDSSLSSTETREGARTAFQTMLSQSSEYILPFCNSVLAVLASTEQVVLVKSFLNDCCEVIDNGGYQLAYGTPFHFALASYNNNSHEMARCIDRLKTPSGVIEMRWGSESPNHIVSQYHCAWYMIHQKQNLLGLQMLDHCLPISERVLGPSHVVTVNCLAMKSRALKEIKSHHEALSTLHDATNRLSDVTGLLQAYKFRLRLRLAKLQAIVGEHAAAEANFQGVLEFRLGSSGLVSNGAWVVIHALTKLMKSQGRQTESKSFHQSWYELWLEQVEYKGTAYLARHGTLAPFFCRLCELPGKPPTCCSHGGQSSRC